MKTDLAFDVMERILPDVVEILKDEGIQTVKNRVKSGDSAVVDSMTELLPLIITKHRKAFYSIVSGIAGVSAEVVANMEFKEVIKYWREGFIDEMLGFFVASLRMVLKA